MPKVACHATRCMARRICSRLSTSAECNYTGVPLKTQPLHSLASTASYCVRPQPSYFKSAALVVDLGHNRSLFIRAAGPKLLLDAVVRFGFALATPRFVHTVAV